MTDSLTNILVVDDEPEVLAVLAELVTGLGYSVATASNGTEAVGAVLRTSPDLVLLDIRMPDMNGLEVLKQIHTIDSTIPVLMVSGVADTGLVADALTSGAVGYVPKPVKLQYLEHLIAAFLNVKGRSAAAPTTEESDGEASSDPALPREVTLCGASSKLRA